MTGVQTCALPIYVIDTDYMEAFDKVYEWSVALNKLPSYENLTMDDAEDVEKLWSEFEAMSDYEKTFIAKENTDKITKYHERIEEMKKNQDEDDDDGGEVTEPDGTEGGGETKPEENGTVTPEGSGSGNTGEEGTETEE